MNSKMQEIAETEAIYLLKSALKKVGGEGVGDESRFMDSFINNMETNYKMGNEVDTQSHKNTKTTVNPMLLS